MNLNPNNISTAYVLAMILVVLVAILVIVTGDKKGCKNRKK